MMTVCCTQVRSGIAHCKQATNSVSTAKCVAGGHSIHVFMKCKRSDCWRLVKKDNAIYNGFASARHNNENEEIVLLLKVPEEIEIGK